jgi:hypothetical protein|tara:strand:+ start:886 stop:1200 length:315 start_codon:yes stop_codon:yes gene_type:complete
MIAKSFRGNKIPNTIKSKSELIRYVLETERNNEPISNGEFVFDLKCTRFGGVLHDLRQEGYDIVTLPAKQRGHFLYYLVSAPSDGDTMRRKGERKHRKLQKQYK